MLAKILSGEDDIQFHEPEQTGSGLIGQRPRLPLSAGKKLVAKAGQILALGRGVQACSVHRGKERDSLAGGSPGSLLQNSPASFGLGQETVEIETLWDRTLFRGKLLYANVDWCWQQCRACSGVAYIYRYGGGNGLVSRGVPGSSCKCVSPV
jgi:hypothetical protein